MTFGLITGSTGTSGSGGQGTSNTPVVLSYITKGGGPSGYDYWLIEWRVAKGMSGWIIQELNTTATFKDGKVVNLPTYWEAFRVSGVGSGSRPQDLFDRVGISLSQVQVQATASFYKGLSLPSTFKVEGTPYTGILPSTFTRPNLGPATGSSVSRSFLSKFHKKGH